MNISFSTLGCPNWMWGEIVSAAKDLGFGGIELRGLGDDLFVPEAKMFGPDNIANTKRELDALGLKISCLSSGCKLYKEDFDPNPVIREIETAGKLGAPYVRVLGDKWGPPGKPVKDEVVAGNTAKLLPYAEDAGVTLLLETNGAYADTGRLKSLIAGIGSGSAAVLWDINHPARYFGESAETTWNNIGQYVRHMHIKDSVMENGGISYKMVGYGDLPIREAASLLKAGGFGGFLSLEWTKRWNPELEDAGIVFAHYAHIIGKIWSEA